MRIPKLYLLNVALLILAIASWAAFLRQYSPARRRAEAEAFAQSFLNRQLPEQAYLRLLLDASEGQIQAFPPLEGKKVGPSELKQIEMNAQCYISMALARKTPNTEGWKRLGEAQITSKDKTITLPVYETPDGQLGYQRDGSYYRTEGDISKRVLEFIHDVQHR